MKKIAGCLFLILLSLVAVMGAEAPKPNPVLHSLQMDTVGTGQRVHIRARKIVNGDTLEVYFYPVDSCMSLFPGGPGSTSPNFLYYVPCNSNDTIRIEDQSLDTAKYFINNDTTVVITIQGDTVTSYSQSGYVRWAPDSGISVVWIADTIGQPDLAGRISIEGMLALSLNGSNYDFDTTVTPTNGKAFIFDGTKFALQTPSGSGWNWTDSAGEPPFWVDSAKYASKADSARAIDTAFAALATRIRNLIGPFIDTTTLDTIQNAHKAVLADSALAVSPIKIGNFIDTTTLDTIENAHKATFADSARAIDTAFAALKTRILNLIGPFIDTTALDTLENAHKATFADSARAIDTGFAALKVRILNLVGPFIDTTLLDTIENAHKATRSDSTTKIDTTYSPFQTYVSNHGGTGPWVGTGDSIWWINATNDTLLLAFKRGTGQTGLKPNESGGQLFIDSVANIVGTTGFGIDNVNYVRMSPYFDGFDTYSATIYTASDTEKIIFHSAEDADGDSLVIQDGKIIQGTAAFDTLTPSFVKWPSISGDSSIYFIDAAGDSLMKIQVEGNPVGPVYTINITGTKTNTRIKFDSLYYIGFRKAAGGGEIANVNLFSGDGTYAINFDAAGKGLDFNNDTLKGIVALNYRGYWLPRSAGAQGNVLKLDTTGTRDSLYWDIDSTGTGTGNTFKLGVDSGDGSQAAYLINNDSVVIQGSTVVGITHNNQTVDTLTVRINANTVATSHIADNTIEPKDLEDGAVRSTGDVPTVGTTVADWTWVTSSYWIKADGTTPLTGNWTTGDFSIATVNKLTAETLWTGVLGTTNEAGVDLVIEADTVRPDGANSGWLGTTIQRFARVNSRSAIFDTAHADILSSNTEPSPLILESDTLRPDDDRVAVLGTQLFEWKRLNAGSADVDTLISDTLGNCNFTDGTVDSADLGSIYIDRDGGTPLSANWAAGDFDLTGLDKLTGDSIMPKADVSAGSRVGSPTARWQLGAFQAFSVDTARPPTTNTGYVGTTGLRFLGMNARAMTADTVYAVNQIIPTADLAADCGTSSLRWTNFYAAQGLFGTTANAGYVRMPWGSNPNTSGSGTGGMGVDTNSFGIEANFGNSIIALTPTYQQKFFVIPDSGVLARDTIQLWHFDSLLCPGTGTMIQLRMYSKVATTDTVFIMHWTQETTAGTETMVDTLGLSSASNFVSTSFNLSAMTRGSYLYAIPLAKTPGTGYTIEYIFRYNEGT